MIENLENFRLEDYLNDRNIYYRTTGKNVTYGWIETGCLFCNDPSEHFGIKKTTKKISCWRCDVKGTVVKYIMKYESCSFSEALNIIQKYTDRELQKIKIHEQKNIPKINVVTVPLKESQKKYLRKRGFNPDELEKTYKLKSMPNYGKEQNRIFIPIIYKGKIVSFTCMDHTRLKTPKYLNALNEESVYNIKDCLYNIDSVEDTAVIVEGPTDVWRGGKGFVATLGTKYTLQQLVKLEHAKRVFILYDTDAYEASFKLSYEIQNIVRNVERIQLKTGDPADMTEDDMKKLRKDLFSRIY